MDVPRPARTLNLAAKLKDAANTKSPQLSFQCKAVQDFHSRQAHKNDPPSSSPMGSNPNAPSSASAVPTLQNKCSVSSVVDDNNNDNDNDDNDDDDKDGMFTAKKRHAAATMSQAKRKRAISIMVDDDMTDTEAKIRDKGMVSLNHYVQKLN